MVLLLGGWVGSFPCGRVVRSTDARAVAEAQGRRRPRLPFLFLFFPVSFMGGWVGPLGGGSFLNHFSLICGGLGSEVGWVLGWWKRKEKDVTIFKAEWLRAC